MLIRLFSYLMASIAVGASFLFGHDRVLRFMDRHLPLRPKRPPLRPARIHPHVVDECTARNFPPEMIPRQSTPGGYEQHL